MNMQQIMAQAQRLQRDITNKKNQVNEMEFVGKSDWVEISFKGSKEVKSVDIVNEDAFNKENKEILCDMILLAIKDGLSKIDKTTEEKLGSYANMSDLF